MSSYTCKYCGNYISHYSADGFMNEDPAYHALSCPAKRTYDESRVYIERIKELEKRIELLEEGKQE